eukprot:bmy_14559T0
MPTTKEKPLALLNTNARTVSKPKQEHPTTGAGEREDRRIKRNLKRASEIYNSLGVLVKKKGQSLLVKVTGLTSFGLWVKMAERGYSFSLTTFSPSGKLLQIEYALAAVAGGAPSMGIKAANGVVLATEKKQKSILYEE